MTGRGISTRTRAITLASTTGALTALALVFQGVAGQPDVAETLLVSSFALLGLVIALRVPGNTLGWFFLGLAILNSFASATGSLLLVARDVWQMPNLAKFAAVASSWEWFAFIGGIATFALLLFPDGHLPSPRWRWVARVAGGAITLGCLLLIAMTLSDLDLAVADVEADMVGPLWLNIGLWIAWPTVLLCAIASFASLVVRWRRATGVPRQQLKWFLYGGLVQLLGIACGFADSAAINALGEASILSLPAAATLAILKFRLYDIDRIISRTVAWTLISVVVGGMYLGGVALMTAVTTPFAGESSLAVAAATLAAATAFGPVRRRIQNAVDHRFNRARYDALRTAETYRGSLRDTIEMERLRSDLLGVVQTTLQPRSVDLWLVAGAGETR